MKKSDLRSWESRLPWRYDLGICKKMSNSQSMTLLLMLDFFEDNGISPAESMGPRMETLETRIALLIKKRMNGMIAILKDIEKSQTKPTAAMLYSLFEQGRTN